MKKVTDEILIAQLDATYQKSREGKPVRGSELKEKCWFLNEEDRRYYLINSDGLPLRIVDSSSL